MPINVYTGLMRSGKSYEVVSEVIVNAIRRGRNVVTNVDGISEEKIHEYLRAKYPDDDHAAYGKIVHVTNADVFSEKFFPYYDDDKTAHTDTIVQPGDLVAIDEAWRFWGKGMKIHKNHQSFILEHGHFTHPVTHVACDMVLMIQDMGTLHTFIKNVVAFSFRTTKKVSLGLSKVYSLNMWEGKTMTKPNHIGQWTRTYKSDIFPLYSSFKGGAEGVMVNADNRQNIFRNWKVWMPFVACFLIIGLAVPRVWRFFHPVEAPKAAQNDEKGSPSPKPGLAGAPGPQTASKPSGVPVSDVWRVVGTMQSGGRQHVVIANAAGAMRLESTSAFQGEGLQQVGVLEGERIATWSAPVSSRGAPAPGPSPLGTPVSKAIEVKK